LELCLKQTLQETPAQAAILLRGEQLLAFSGRFSQESAAEAADILVRTGSVEAENDLIRYARLQTSGEEILLYATLGPGQTLLVLGFSPQVGPRLARVTAHHALQALANLPLESVDVQPASIVEFEPLTAQVDELVQDAVESEPQEQVEDLRLVELLAHAPAPNPEKADDLFNAWVPDEAFSSTEEDFRFPWEEDQVDPDNNISERKADLSDTQPIHENESPPAGDAVAPYAGQLFTCILLPRLPDLILGDELYSELEEWIPQFFDTFGWQLENLVIQPTCLQWSIRVGPGASQSYMVRMLREQSTQHLAEKFPQIAQDSADGDFWAPGYLLVSGRQPPAEQYIEGFIRQTRRRQGFKVE
jgi:REP element-mobilizing transposase RayT